jgi:4-amino-4-deoxy-L-arabinose transferase-like glycosyltransferase
MKLRTKQKRVLTLLLVLALSFVIRGLTARFIGEHLNDAGWFAFGIYAVFDKQARNILDGKTNALWIDDPAQTEAAIYPPGYPLWLALVYGVSGIRSATIVQTVQWIMDALSVLLIIGIGVTAYDWRTGIWAGVLAAFSPLLALNGATPLADAPTSWIVLGGVWMLLLAAKRRSWRWAIGAGAMVGASCWMRANAMLLLIGWALALLIWTQVDWRERVRLFASVALGAAILLTPIIIRNIVAFRAFVPTGMGVGTNLWEGIGETNRASEFGAVYGDGLLIEQERRELGVSPDQKFNLYYPDGVARDRARARKAFAVITAHPVWYAGVMIRRMAGVLKFAGEPLPFYGSSGFNITSRKSLPPYLHGSVVAFVVNILGMIQSVLRYVALPLMLLGLFLALRTDTRITLIILVTVFYYLVVGSFLHTEIRYGLAMQALLYVFAGIAVAQLPMLVSKINSKKEAQPRVL